MSIRHHPLARLAAEDPTRWSFVRLWRAMPAAHRTELVEAVLSQTGDFEVKQHLLLALSRATGFRLETLARRTPGEVSALHVRLPGRRLPVREDLFRIFHLERRRPLLAAYLDGAGIPHADGLVEEGWDGLVPSERVGQGADAVAAAFPVDEAVVYLITLRLLSPYLCPGVEDWIAEKGRETLEGSGVVEAGAAGAAAETPSPEIVLDAEEEGGAPEPDRSGVFSPLDRAVIRAGVDSAQGITGAPSRAEVEDMVDEIIHMNASRHRSFFHRGFLDILFGLEWRTTLPAENRHRREWYVAGWLSGLGRIGDGSNMLALLDREASARTLMDTPIDPTPRGLVLSLLFGALCDGGRGPEAVNLVTEADLRESPRLLPELLARGTELLRRDDPESAQPFFDRLAAAMDLLEAEGEPVGEDFFLEVRRRRAHCYRQLGDADGARRLLVRLLDDDPDPGIRAMVLADLGLLDAGYRSLAEVRMWRSATERSTVRADLERGEARFREAHELRSQFSAHGAWPLGVLALARGEWAEAAQLLPETLASFRSRPQRYRRKLLLPRVRVAAGIAVALALDAGPAERARDLLVEGLEEGGRIPRDLLADVLAGLDAREAGVSGQVLEVVLAEEEADALDELWSSNAARRTAAFAEALLVRGSNPARSGEVRATDLQRALDLFGDPLFPDPDRGVEGARAALDLLEDLARGGHGVAEFLELLDVPARVDPAWSLEEASWAAIHLLEAEQRFDDAAARLHELFGRVLARARWDAADEAAAILSRLRGYPDGAAWREELAPRLAAWSEAEDVPDPRPLAVSPDEEPVRILIVGGDERQHELRSRVQARLDEEGVRIQVRHRPTGWSGNWSDTLDRALAESRANDAVVILRFIRTEFGRSLRARLTCPWTSCPGVGTRQVAQAAKTAAAWARREGGDG